MKLLLMLMLFALVRQKNSLSENVQNVSTPPEMPSVSSIKDKEGDAPASGTKVKVFDKNGKLIESPKTVSLESITKVDDDKKTMEMIVKDFEKTMKQEESFVVKSAIAPAFEGRFGEWSLLSMVDVSGAKVCYMVGYPFNMVQNHDKQRRPFVMVSMDKHKRLSFMLAAGFYFYKNSSVSISMGGKNFNIDAKDYIAITKTIVDDAKIVMSMLREEKLMSYSRSNKGSYAVDVYSLRGFYEGYKRMLEICV